MFKSRVANFDGISEEKIWEYKSEPKKVDGLTWIGSGKDGSVAGRSTLCDGDHPPASCGGDHLHGQAWSPHAVKIHALAFGPWSLVTQQPLVGKAQYGGRRLPKTALPSMAHLFPSPETAKLEKTTELIEHFQHPTFHLAGNDIWTPGHNPFN